MKKRVKKKSFFYIPDEKLNSANLILIGIGVVFTLIICEVAYYTLC